MLTRFRMASALLLTLPLVVGFPGPVGARKIPAKARLSLFCAADDAHGFRLEARAPEGETPTLSTMADVCGQKAPVRTLGRDESGKKTLYDLRSTMTPLGTRRKNGSVVPGKVVQVTHRAVLRRDPFAAPVSHVSRGRYSFDVPDYGAPTTPVVIEAKRKLVGNPELFVEYSQISGLQVRSLDRGETVAFRKDLEGMVRLDLAPGRYQLRLEETTSYRATGPRNAKGAQPPFSRSVAYTVTALPPQPDPHALPLDEQGWTDLTAFLSSDSRIVYLSSEGDDTAAAAVKGRGYYRSDDPEIGPDPTSPVGLIIAYRTVPAARAVHRSNRRLDTYPDDPRYPEWMLFRRGEEFSLGTQALVDNVLGGPSPQERRVYAAWGPVEAPRPILRGTPGTFLTPWGSRGASHIAVASLEFAYPVDLDPEGLLRPPSIGFSIMYDASHILIEDVRFPQVLNDSIQLGADEVVVRRSVVSGNWNSSAHNQGVFVGGVRDVTIEENVFDMNGYKEDPWRPAVWTRGMRSDVPEEPGIRPDYGPYPNIQPKRTFYDRNAYLSSYDSMRFRGNIVSRDGGGGSVQMRVGGIAERNLLMFNEAALTTCSNQAIRTSLQDALVVRNLVLHDDHLLPPGGAGQGLRTCAGDRQTAILTNNIVAHFHRINNAGSLFGGAGILADSAQGVPDMPASALVITDNTGLTSRHGEGLGVGAFSATAGVQAGVAGGNVIGLTVTGVAARFGDALPVPSISIGNGVADPNLYYTAASSSFARASTTGNFAAWQEAGFDPVSQQHATLEDLAAAAGWRTATELGDAQGRHGWERDIVSYLESIDPTYVVNEDVTVDDGVPVAHRRADAVRVWPVLADYRGFPHDSGLRPPMSEADAKLTARRYHAFLTFIERAKQNRKGAWDPRYTADAVNNYIRAGFGKPPVSGPWTAHLVQAEE